MKRAHKWQNKGLSAQRQDEPEKAQKVVADALVAASGSVQLAADRLKVAARTLRRWIRASPELRAARDRGLARLAGSLGAE